MTTILSQRAPTASLLAATSKRTRDLSTHSRPANDFIIPLPTEILTKITQLLIRDERRAGGKAQWKDVQGFAMASKALLQIFRPVWFHTLTIDSFEKWAQVIDTPSAFTFVRHIQLQHPSRFWKERWYPIFFRFFKNLLRITIREDVLSVLCRLLKALPGNIHELHVTLESNQVAPQEFYTCIPRKLPELRSLSMKVDGMFSLPIGIVQDVAGANALADLLISSDGGFRYLRHLDLGFGLSEYAIFNEQCPESCGERGCCVKCNPLRSQTEDAERQFTERSAQIAPRLETVRVRTWFSRNSEGTVLCTINRQRVGHDEVTIERKAE